MFELRFMLLTTILYCFQVLRVKYQIIPTMTSLWPTNGSYQSERVLSTRKMQSLIKKISLYPSRLFLPQTLVKCPEILQPSCDHENNDHKLKKQDTGSLVTRLSRSINHGLPTSGLHIPWEKYILTCLSQYLPSFLLLEYKFNPSWLYMTLKL